MSKNAFSMLELVFVIIIIGIIVASALPKQTDNEDDINKIKSTINFTKHLAINDYKYKDEAEWWKHLWRISFIDNSMVVWQDSNGDTNIDEDEIAKLSASSTKKMDGRTNKSYSVSNNIIATMDSVCFDRFARAIDCETIGDHPYDREFKDVNITYNNDKLTIYSRTGYIEEN